MNYEPIIGLEIHLQPKTKSKMFCACDANYFGQKPNTHTCPTCLGLPGALPTANEKAIELCTLLALALNCNINKITKFDRKNYFYPDLPKGYQISQYDEPIGYQGYVEADVDGDTKRFRITRVHMEEDTGKSIHRGNDTLLDFNKSGIPLIEIVTEADFANKLEVDAFAKRLRQIVRYCGISEANMEKGQMRYELNISLRKKGESGFPNYKVEVKNIGSISILQKIIDFETIRQSEILDKGKTPKQETRGVRSYVTGETVSQRTKETSADYRYFPEPDIPPIEISDKQIEALNETLVELPQEKKFRYINDFKLDPDLAESIVSKVAMYKFFEKSLESMSDEDRIIYAKEVAKWLVGDLVAYIKKHKIRLGESKITPELLSNFVIICEKRSLNGNLKKQVFSEMLKTGDAADAIITQLDLSTIDNEGEIIKIIKLVIEENPKVVEDCKTNPNAIKFLLGQVMRLSQGKANVAIANTLLEEHIKKIN